MNTLRILSLMNTALSVILLLVFLFTNFQIFQQELNNDVMFEQLRNEITLTKINLEESQKMQQNTLLREMNERESFFINKINNNNFNNAERKINKKIEELEFETNDFSETIKKAIPSVVKITVRVSGKYQEFPIEEVEKVEESLKNKGYLMHEEDDMNYITVTGSGVFVRSDLIVTNKHVANTQEEICEDPFVEEFFICSEEDAEIKIENFKHETSYGSLVDVSYDYDLAFVKTYLRGNSLALSKEVSVGEEVVALGNPFSIEFTATKGMVSAVNRNLNDGLGNFWLQTDTPINPGNSGGPLINKDGEIVGIVTQKEGFLSEGLGYAVPARIVKEELRYI